MDKTGLIDKGGWIKGTNDGISKGYDKGTEDLIKGFEYVKNFDEYEI